MPTRFGSIAAHSLGDKTKSRRPACPGSELQAPTLGQAQRLTEFNDHKADATIAEDFLGRGQNIHLAPPLGDQKPMRINES